MLDLFSGSAYALETRFYHISKSRIEARLAAGLPALSEDEKKIRHYAHVDAEGYPTMWTAEEGGTLHRKVAVVVGAGTIGASLARVLAGPSGGGSSATGANVAVIPVQGTIQKRGGMCSTGTKQLGAMLARANADPEIGSIVLDVDSPGGAVDGTEEFANLVKSSAKPVVAYIDGLGASAAYWVASQASSIFINSATTGFAGSLGVLCTHVNESAALEKQGNQVTVLRSSRAVDKAKMNSFEPLSDELKAEITANLDSIAGTFIAAVESGREGLLTSKEDVFTGKVYNGKDALKHGLVDKIGSLQDAVNHAAKLGRSTPGASALTNSLNQVTR